MNISQLQTPCLILDKEKMLKNIFTMNQRLDKHNITLRPHGKTAKCIDVMNYVLSERSTGITVSTLKEAEYYFTNGINNLIYAVGIAPVKLYRVTELIKKGADLAILLDTAAQAALAEKEAKSSGITIPVLLEIDSDGHRSGLKSHSKELLELGKVVDDFTNLELRGVLTHAGASYQCKDIDCIKQIAEQERLSAVNSAKMLYSAGLPCPVVSIGSTPTVHFGKSFEGITEVRAGVYIFNDLAMAGLGVCKFDDIALSVLCSVIGHQKDRGWVITDAGWMALSRDQGTAGQRIDQDYGKVCDQNGSPISDLRVTSTNQEHGIIASPNGSDININQYPVGTLLRILPNHACATAAMHLEYQVLEKGKIIDSWPRINFW